MKARSGPEGRTVLGVVDRHGLEPVDFGFTITVAGMNVPDDCSRSIRAFELNEALGQPFDLTVTLAIADLFFDVERLVGARCVLELGRGTASRTLVGVILRAGVVEATDDGLVVELVGGPVIAPLALVVRSRVFRNRTALAIVDEVMGPTLTTADGTIDGSRLAGPGITRDHCVQYRESDLAFASRLLAEEGLTYVMEGTTMILLDRLAAFAAVGRTPEEPVQPLPWVPVVPTLHEDAITESVQSLRRTRSLTRNRWRVSAWDWKSTSPGAFMHEATEPGRAPSLHGSWHDERRLYEAQGGDGPAIDDGEARLARHRDHEQTRSIVVQGESNHTGFAPARAWELAQHPHRELDGEYVLVSVTHRGGYPWPDARAVPARPHYTNTFVALPRAWPYRPAVPEKPRIHGIQTAIVVGPSVRSHREGVTAANLPTRVHTDAHGRVLLRHAWDEHAQNTCWVRVAETSEFAFSTPRIGTEVVVAFEDGDPDRPLVVGVVHNGERRHPEPRPGEATRMGWKTLSSPSGDGYNEISLDDTDLAEEIRVHAERDLNARIRRNETRRIGVDCTHSVGRDETRRVGRHRNTAIAGHDYTEIRGTRTVLVDGDVDNHGRRGALTSVARGPCIVRANDEIRLECGDSTIVMTPKGIEIHAPSILLKSTERAPETLIRSSLHLHARGSTTVGDEVHTQSRGAALTVGRDALVAEANRSALTLNGDARLEAVGEGVVHLHAATHAHVTAAETVRVIANSVAMEVADTLQFASSGSARIEAAGPLVVRGKPIRLNCPE